MKLHVALAVFEGCPQAFLNDKEAIAGLLDTAVAAGAFTPLGTLVVPFSPVGVTGCAIVGESHVALHSWPEEGRLFVDIASCSTRGSVTQALEALRRALPAGRLALLDERELDADVPSGGLGRNRCLGEKLSGDDHRVIAG